MSHEKLKAYILANPEIVEKRWGPLDGRTFDEWLKSAHLTRADVEKKTGIPARKLQVDVFHKLTAWEKFLARGMKPLVLDRSEGLTPWGSEMCGPGAWERWHESAMPWVAAGLPREPLAPISYKFEQPPAPGKPPRGVVHPSRPQPFRADDGSMVYTCHMCGKRYRAGETRDPDTGHYHIWSR